MAWAFNAPAMAAADNTEPSALLGERWKGTATRVSDGDTLWVRPDAPNAKGQRRRPVKLRLLGIDAPERCQAGGAEATEALRALVWGKSLTVQTKARDIHERWLAEVQVQGRNVGAELVRQGQAWSNGRGGGPFDREEKAARLAARGVFSSPSPMEPRTFRRTHGPCP